MTKFDSLYEKFLNRVNEDMPITLMPGMEAGDRDVPVTFPEKANYTLTPEQVVSVINDIIDYLLTRNRYSPLPYKSFQTDVIADKIVGRTSLNRTKATYAARVLHNAMIEAGIIKDERSGTSINQEPSEETVQSVADTVSAETESMSMETPVGDDEEEASVYHKAKDFPAEVDDEELEAAWNKIPEDTDIEWSKLLKLVGLSKAERMKNIRAIIPVLDSEKVTDEESEGEVPLIDPDFESDDDDIDLSEIDPTIVRRSPYRNSNY
jgi:hypothetical protein